MTYSSSNISSQHVAGLSSANAELNPFSSSSSSSLQPVKKRVRLTASEDENTPNSPGNTPDLDTPYMRSFTKAPLFDNSLWALICGYVPQEGLSFQAARPLIERANIHLLCQQISPSELEKALLKISLSKQFDFVRAAMAASSFLNTPLTTTKVLTISYLRSSGYYSADKVKGMFVKMLKLLPTDGQLMILAECQALKK